MSGLFGEVSVSMSADLREPKALQEMFLCEEVSLMSQEQRTAFLESKECEMLVEAQVLRKPTMMRLSKQDDQARRVKLAAYQLAKENKDPNWDKLVKTNIKRKQLIAAIMKRWETKAIRNANLAQKDYIKTAGKTTANFKKMGGDVR